MECLKRSIFSFWFLLVCIVFVCAFFASYYYWTVFGSQLSTNSSDWSAFGSYFGGVFGPLISFCTLLAVLKTVYLQRELLNAQKDEFRAMNSMQSESLEAQSEQLDLARAESKQSEVQSYQTSQINLIEMFIGKQIRMVSNFEEQITATKIASISMSEKLSALNKFHLGKVKANNSANSLLVLAFEISITQFSDAGEIKALLAEKLPSILDLEMPAS